VADMLRARVIKPLANERRLQILNGVLRGARIRQWTLYRRDGKRIAAVKRAFQSTW
jgi:hypothetical protein